MAALREQVARLRSEIATLEFDIDRTTDRYAMDMVINFLGLCRLDTAEEMVKAIEILNTSTMAALIEVENGDAVRVEVTENAPLKH